MGIMDKIFGQSQQPQQQPVQQQQQQQATPPGGIQTPTGDVTQQSQVTDPNGVIPSGEGTTKEGDSPLDNFAKLWETNPNAEGEDQTPQPLNAEEVQKVVDNAQFAEISPEVLATIQEGGENAVQAFQTALNSGLKNVMVQATLVGDKLANKKVEDAVQRIHDRIPNMLRQQSITDHSKQANPIFSHPAVQPIMEATQQALAKQHPEATPAQILDMTQDYILAIAQPLQSESTDDSDSGVPKEEDWEKFLQ